MTAAIVHDYDSFEKLQNLYVSSYRNCRQTETETVFL
jgi:hypothetical protein